LRQFSYKILYFFLLVGCTAHRGIVTNIPEMNQDIVETNYYKLFFDATKNALFGNYASAVTLYNTCLEIYPENPAPYYQLSSIYIRNQNANKAIKFARKAVELDTVNIWYKKNLATYINILAGLIALQY
jgi:tetratricopeptide (TPR) repeat protein